MARAGGRTQDCTHAQARARQGQAKKFLEVADLVAAEPESASVSASLAVLAGIAASDAAEFSFLAGPTRGVASSG